MATADRPTTRHLRRTIPTAMAASGPKSGPTTMAPTMRIGWSLTTPTAAIIVATAMKTRKVAVSRTSSPARASTSCQTTASSSPPKTLAALRFAFGESVSSTDSIAIEPERSRPAACSSPRSSLAATRSTSQSTTSPVGSAPAPGSRMTLET